MPIRLNGMVSGMDTESIVTELMKAQRLKSTKIENKITRAEWTKDKWTGINTKLYSFYTSSLSKMRLQSSFSTKKASSSNENKLEIKASSSAPIGSQTIKVQQLASSQFVTGTKLEPISGIPVSSSTKLTDLNLNVDTTISIETGGKVASLDINEYSTVKDFTDACKEAGLNATYDTNQNRFFISSKESGEKNAFFITASTSQNAQERNDIRESIGYGEMTESQKDTVDKALLIYISDTSVAADKAKAKESILAATQSRVRADMIQAYKTDQNNINAVTQEEVARLTAELGTAPSADVLKAAVDKKLLQYAAVEAEKEYKAWKTPESGTPTPADNKFLLAANDLNTRLQNYAVKAETSTDTDVSGSLSNLGLFKISKNVDGSVNLDDPNISGYIKATDAKVTYNGAELISSSNTFTANNITFTVKGVTTGADMINNTADDEIISLTVSNDTQAVYDMIKGFVTSYNDIMKEMNDSYNAKNAKGFDPLTDDEKEAMSESQIDQWEGKIKASLLKRDTTLNSLISTIRTSLSESVVVDSKRYTLSSFGVKTGNYTEKGQLHINGDTDDSMVSAYENDLMTALNEDPDKVMKVFTELTGKLYETMGKSMKSTSMRSALTFYNDKAITKDITNYQGDLKKLEDKLQGMEDRYYKQFSAMETAMAKMNSQSSALASMLGTNQQ